MSVSIATMNSIFRQPPALPTLSWGLERRPVVVLVLSVFFLQGYAIGFWAGLLGMTGWGVSIGLEVLHLWLWYRAAVSAGMSRTAWMILAVAATGLLLTGSLHDVTQPLLQQSARVETADHERESLRGEARALKAKLAAFRNMAVGQGPHLGREGAGCA